MVNIGVGLLIGFLILLLLLIVSVLTLVIVSPKEINEPPNENLPLCSTNISFGSLYQITNDTPICCVNNKLTTNYYIGCDSQYNYVVGTMPVNPHDVCIQYCSNATGPCTGPSYNKNSAQENYDECMKQLSGNNCIPPIPVAAKGTTLYYANSVTPLSCTGSSGNNGCFLNCSSIT